MFPTAKSGRTLPDVRVVKGKAKTRLKMNTQDNTIQNLQSARDQLRSVQNMNENSSIHSFASGMEVSPNKLNNKIIAIQNSELNKASSIADHDSDEKTNKLTQEDLTLQRLKENLITNQNDWEKNQMMSQKVEMESDYGLSMPGQVTGLQSNSKQKTEAELVMNKALSHSDVPFSETDLEAQTKHGIKIAEAINSDESLKNI